jgi:hypothetical protein
MANDESQFMRDLDRGATIVGSIMCVIALLIMAPGFLLFWLVGRIARSIWNPEVRNG